MNGWIYDPTLGRFLQAEPHIHALMSSQNYSLPILPQNVLIKQK